MGVTQKSIQLIEEVLKTNKVQGICDLGAQNDYRDIVIKINPVKYPYISEWWENKGVQYLSIDLNGENGAVKWDLDKPLPTQMKFDLVCDFGTGEHTRNFESCMTNIHNLVKLGGVVIRENPLVDNWPAHGFNYVDANFYQELAELNGYEILKLETHAAMGNIIDGWNQICVYRKTKDAPFKMAKFVCTLK